MSSPAVLPPLVSVRDWRKAPTKDARIPTGTLFAPPPPAILEPTRDALSKALGDAPREVREAAVDGYQPDDEDVLASWTLSTADVDRPNDSIRQEGWELTNFRRNPVVLFAHDSSALPVARSLATYLGRGTLKGTSLFTPAVTYDFGATVGRMVRAGFLSAVSVGFRPLKWEIAEDRDDGDSWWAPVNFLEQELLEYSVVPIPANPHALLDGKSFAAAGIGAAEASPVIAWAERQLDGETPLIVERDVLEQLLPPWRQLSKRQKAATNKEATMKDKETLEGEDKEQGTEDEKPGEEPEEQRAEGGEDEPVADEEEQRATMVVCPACGHEGDLTEFTAPEKSERSDDVDSTTDEDPDQSSDGAEKAVQDDGFRSPEELAAYIGARVREEAQELVTQLTGRLPD